jgi:hypothetical protein
MKSLSTLARAIAISAALLVVVSTADAEQRRAPPPPPPPANCFLFVFCSLPSAPGANWAIYKESGTLGRQGLGASPFHPEGPGNRSY